MTNIKTSKVLILTGGFLSGKEESFFDIIKRQIEQWRFSKFSWLETIIKLNSIEPIIYVEMLRKKKKIKELERFFKTSFNETPELTEVILATLLSHEGISYETLTIDDLFSRRKKSEQLLQTCDCIFLSTTLLRDLSEIIPIIEKIKVTKNHLVLGGPLTQILKENLNLIKGVDVITLGYGEFVVPAIVKWIKSDFKILYAPENGKLEKIEDTFILYSGHPNGTSLDSLTTPDWSQSQKYHGTQFEMIHYESVRGCPYRCSFCNYPFLFNDDNFRYKSAKKIADDWEKYETEMGPKIINCLDSLFTMPRKRLFELCDEIEKRKLKSRWICYARSEDMAIDEVCIAMKKAGILQVQIGLETGSPQILKNMNKHCSLQENIKAIENCRKYGITSVVSLIVGFPGETAETIEETYQLMKMVKPDFFFIATFSTRAKSVPILSDKNRDTFGIWIDENVYSVSPYWEHKTMSAFEVGESVRQLQLRLMEEKISLNAFVFYKGMPNYDIDDRIALLDFQSEAVVRQNLLPKIFKMCCQFVARRIKSDIEIIRKISKNRSFKKVA
jgi:tRNA A37 methylthiotransferase MiaB